MAKFDPSKIWSSSKLPTLPVVAVRLLELSKNPDTEMREVVDLIKTDPAISAKILKAVNSTLFGFSSKVTSIDRAVPLLGTTVVNSLALSFSLVESAMVRGPLAELYSQYWLQSIVQAAAAEALAKQSSGGLDCEFFLTGLLVDIGRLAMLKSVPDQCAPVVQTALERQEFLHESEERLLGVDHAEIGATLMANWGLPEPLRQAIRLHNAGLDDLLAAGAAGEVPLVKAAAVAGAAGDYFQTTCKGRALTRLRELTRAFYNFSETDLENYLAHLKSRIESMGELFSIDTQDLGDPGDLMGMANDQLAQLALRAHVAGTAAMARQEVVEKEKRELETHNAQLRQQALHDPLTRVYNRHFFEESLGKTVQQCCRTATTLGLVFLDVDRFKQINDKFGHPFGDLVLKRVAVAVGETIRSADILARYGGEEFVVLASQPTEKGMAKLAERIRERIESEPIQFQSARVPVTVSVGAALILPGRNELTAGERLVEAADQAMYEAKQSGRNTVRMRLLMEDNLRRQLQAVTQRKFSRWLVQHNKVDQNVVLQALADCPIDHRPLGELTRQYGILDEVQVRTLLVEQQHSDLRFGELAIRNGWMDEAQLIELLALQQENPRSLAISLVRLRAIDNARSGQLLEEYKASVLVLGSAMV